MGVGNEWSVGSGVGEKKMKKKNEGKWGSLPLESWGGEEIKKGKKIMKNGDGEPLDVGVWG